MLQLKTNPANTCSLIEMVLNSMLLSFKCERLDYSKQFGYTLEQYIQRITGKAKAHQERKIQRAKEKGQEYYTSDRVRKIQYAQRLAQYT